jgi:hypothetical protein
MNPIEISEIRSIADYEIERKALRPKIIELKERRRIQVGAHLTFLFENRDTVRYQIQEMLRIERIVEAAAIRHEVDTYNELIPFRGELSATLLIEYDSPEERQVALNDLLGLEKHVRIAVAELEPARARFDFRQRSNDRLSAVQYVKFPLTPEQRTAWRRGVRLVIDHPEYQAEAALSDPQLSELAGDFD